MESGPVVKWSQLNFLLVKRTFESSLVQSCHYFFRVDFIYVFTCIQ